MDNNQNQFTPEAAPQVTPTVEEPRSQAIKSMVFGILSIALSYTVILGIIFSVIAKRNAAPILANFAGTSSAGFAKAGKITGTIGFIVSLVSIGIYVLAFFAGILIGLAAVAG